MRHDLAVTSPLELPPEEMRRLLALMVGELNASHLGAGGPPATQPYVGKLGVRFARAAHEREQMPPSIASTSHRMWARAPPRSSDRSSSSARAQ